MSKVVVEELKQMIDKGMSLQTCGKHFGVSKQRIYQVLTQFDLDTPEHKRKRQSDSWTAAQRWLWRMIVHKCPVSKAERLEIFNAIPIPTHCPILGLELNYDDLKVYRAENSPSVDRIDSNKGYVLENMHIISWRANRIKNDGTLDELKAIVNYLDRIDN